MATMKKIVFTLGRDGSSSIEVEGTVGDECLELTKDFETALGTLTNREFTESYDTVDRITENVQDNG